MSNDCGTCRGVLPPQGDLVCEATAIDDALLAEIDPCDLSLPVCYQGTLRSLGFSQLLDLMGRTLVFDYGTTNMTQSSVADCQLNILLPEPAKTCIVDGDGVSYPVDDQDCFIIPKACIVDSDGDSLALDADGCFVLPEVVIVDGNGDTYITNEDGEIIVPQACIVDDSGDALAINADGCFVLPEVVIVDGNGDTYITNEDGEIIVPRACIVDGDGVSYPVDPDGCFVIEKVCISPDAGNILTTDDDGCLYVPETCVVDGAGTLYPVDANGCIVIDVTDPECGTIEIEGTNITIGPEQTNQVNIDDFVSNSGTGSLLYNVDEDSAEGIYILSVAGSNVSYRADQTSCDWSFAYTVACGGQVVGNGVVSGKLTAGSEVFGESLMDATDFDSAVEGTVAPGNEFAPGWSNPTLPYKFNDYPPDTSIAIMEGDFDGAINDPGIDGRRFAAQVAFPGDPDFGIPAYDRWFYANGNNTGGPYIIAERVVTGIVPGETYELVAYASNAIRPEETFGDAPLTQFRIDGVQVGANIDVPYHATAHNGVDVWERHTVRWTAPAGTTSATFSIYDAREGIQGDDFALVIVGMQQVEVCP